MCSMFSTALGVVWKGRCVTYLVEGGHWGVVTLHIIPSSQTLFSLCLFPRILLPYTLMVVCKKTWHLNNPVRWRFSLIHTEASSWKSLVSSDHNTLEGCPDTSDFITLNKEDDKLSRPFSVLEHFDKFWQDIWQEMILWDPTFPEDICLGFTCYLV